MAGSMKDALKNSGLAVEKQTETKPEPTKQQWHDELPEVESVPHVPFDAPARGKVTPSKKP